MAYFNEDNVTEQMCIEIAKQAGYEYCGADELREAKNDVIVEPLLIDSIQFLKDLLALAKETLEVEKKLEQTRSFCGCKLRPQSLKTNVC